MAPGDMGLLDRQAQKIPGVTIAVAVLLAAACAIWSCSSDTTEVLQPPSGVPPAPFLYARDTSDTGSYVLRWTRSAQATTYVVQEDRDSTFAAPTTVYAGPDTSCTIAGKNAGTIYFYRVRALNSAGSSPWSDTASVTIVQVSPPSASVSPLMLDFGYVPVDSLKSLPVTIHNAGGMPLVGSCSIDNYLSFQILSSANFSIASGGFYQLVIRFTPGVEAGFAANLTIASNDPVNAGLVVPLRGTSSSLSGVADTIVVLPPSDTLITVHNGPGPVFSVLSFEIRDSLGRHLDAAHSLNLAFIVSGVPQNIDAYVLPATAATDASGRARTTLYSGTIPGLIRCVAWLRRNTDGRLVQSDPVSIRIE